MAMAVNFALFLLQFACTILPSTAKDCFDLNRLYTDVPREMTSEDNVRQHEILILIMVLFYCFAFSVPLCFLLGGRVSYLNTFEG